MFVEIPRETHLVYHGEVKQNNGFKMLVNFKVTIDVNQTEIDITDKLDVDALRNCKIEFLELYEEDSELPFDNSDSAYEEARDRELWEKK